jgi:hypothetical protein
MQMPPTFGPRISAELNLVERTLLRQANLRAAERCVLAENDLKSRLAQIDQLTRGGSVGEADNVPPDVMAELRVSVEDFTSNARALYSSPEELLIALKRTVADNIAPNAAYTRDFVQTVVGWAIEAYFAP